MAKLLFILLAAALAAAAEPCTQATAACMEPVRLAEEGGFINVYRSFPLAQQNKAIRLAYIMIHGAGRNADGYFATALASTFLAGRLNDTMVLAPRFAGNDGRGCQDRLETGEISWTCNGWPAGERPLDNKPIHSYDFVDRLLGMLANRDVFPNLRRIVLAGHSAGGQFVNRYSAAARGPKSLAVPVQFIVSNPSSYLYFDALRPAAGTKCSPKGECTGGFTALQDVSKCAGYNRWRYGLEQRSGYAASIEDAELRNQLVSRDVTYLLGELDTLPIAGFDSSCSAMAQGPTRLERGMTYWNYLKTRFSAEHHLVTVPLCGHNARCIFTADQALKLIFTE